MQKGDPALPLPRPPRDCSALHRTVVTLLREMYPNFQVQEEESLKVNVDGRDTTLFVDIYVKEFHLAIECHGRQHFEFVPHFHHTRDGFAAAVARDGAKAQTIQAAGLSYLIVRFDQEKTLTRQKLLRAITKALKEKKL